MSGPGKPKKKRLNVSEKKTQKDIAEAAGVTEVTVRNRYKSLRRQLGIELPD